MKMLFVVFAWMMSVIIAMSFCFVIFVTWLCTKNAMVCPISLRGNGFVAVAYNPLPALLIVFCAQTKVVPSNRPVMVTGPMLFVPYGSQKSALRTLFFWNPLKG